MIGAEIPTLSPRTVWTCECCGRQVTMWGVHGMSMIVDEGWWLGRDGYAVCPDCADINRRMS